MRWILVLTAIAIMFAFLSASTQPTLAASVSGQADVQLALADLRKPTYKVSFRELDLEDSKRGKTLPLKITYPLGDGRFPVVIFSHGMFGSKDGYSYLAKYWARHGYICIQPTHDDSLKLIRERGQKPNMKAMLKDIPDDKHAWMDRVADISFIIDSLPLDPDFESKMDTDKIAVAGHSLGAFTAMLIGGARVPHKELAPKIDDISDTRVKAIVAMSPQGVRVNDTSIGFDDKQAFPISLPALWLTGDRDNSTFNSVEMRRDAFNNSPTGAKYFLSVNGANHMTFSGSAQDDPSNQSQIGAKLFDKLASKNMLEPYGDENNHRMMIAGTSTLFFDAYVKGDPRIRRMLEEGGYASLVGSGGVTQCK